MARVTLSQPGEDVFIGGSDVEVFGTNSGGEVITVNSGSIRLDPSFNRGGDTVVLPGLATSYAIYREGSTAILTRNDGAVTIRIPFGTDGMEVQFDGGDSRTLLFDTSIGQTTLEGQVVGTSSAPLAAAGAIPAATYDVIGTNAAVTEGDSGTKLLTFTINLDQAVSGSPLTLNYSTSNGTATAGSDYVAASGTVTIPVGQQSGTVSITINGDTAFEANETFTLNLTGAALRNGPEALIGTITNDDQQNVFTAGVDALQGTSGNDAFTAINTVLNSGDSINDGSTTDSDTLSLTVNSATTNRNFSGFSLSNIENAAVTNTSGGGVTLDLSASNGIQTVSTIGSTSSVSFNGLTSNPGLFIRNVGGTGTIVEATYQPGITASANTAVGLTIENSIVSGVSLGTVGAGNTGIETLNLFVTGTSTIGALNTQLTTLNIGGGGDITILSPLVNSVRTISALSASRVTVDFTGNDAAGTGVNFTGSNGSDVVRSGLAADTITTGAGNDSVTDEGGNDVISTGVGNDTVTLLGAGVVNVDTGADDDTVTTSSLDGNDVIVGGSGVDTLNVSNASLNAFIQVSGFEVLNFADSGGASFTSIGVTNVNAPTTGNSLTINASAYGATSAFYYSASGATAFSSNVTTGAGDDQVILTNGIADIVVTGAGNDLVQLSGGDTATLGAGIDIAIVQDGNNRVYGGDDSDLLQLYGAGDSQLYGENGNDRFEIFSSANFTAGDVIDGGAGADTLILTTGTYADVQFTNVTNIEALATRDGAVNATLGAEASEAGIRAIELSGAGNNVLNASAYTAGLTVSSAGGNDQVTLGGGNDSFTGGNGAETVRGRAGDDVLNGGGSNDVLYGDIIFSDAGSLAAYNAFGGGNDTINGGLGDDVLVGGLGKDTLTGGDGADTFRYYSVEDSRISSGTLIDNRDVITDFVAGTDKIDLLQLSAAAGQTVRFAGDFGTFAEAQAALVGTGADNFLDVAFARNANGQAVLFVDIDNNAVLDGNDLQIVLTNVTGTLTAADVNNPHLVTGPDMTGTNAGGYEQSLVAAQEQPFSAYRLTGIFDSQHIA